MAVADNGLTKGRRWFVNREKVAARSSFEMAGMAVAFGASKRLSPSDLEISHVIIARNIHSHRPNCRHHHD